MTKINVKMKMGELLKSGNALAVVIAEKKSFAPEVNIALAQNNAAIEKSLKGYSESRKQIAERFAVKDKNGELLVKNNEYVFEKDEDKNGFLEEAKSLDEVEVDVELQKVEVATMNDGKHEEPTAYDLVAMDFMLKY